jgi:hypothetical protein
VPTPATSPASGTATIVSETLRKSAKTRKTATHAPSREAPHASVEVLPRPRPANPPRHETHMETTSDGMKMLATIAGSSPSLDARAIVAKMTRWGPDVIPKETPKHRRSHLAGSRPKQSSAVGEQGQRSARLPYSDLLCQFRLEESTRIGYSAGVSP